MELHVNCGKNEESAQKAILILVAVALSIIELVIPRIPLLPWLKPGLANAVTLIWIIRYGTPDALLFICIRVWISSFYSGLSLVTIALAIGGGLFSTAGMGVLWSLFKNNRKIHIGTIGISVAGALLHNIGQLGIVYTIFAHNNAVIYQLPAMGIASLFFGLFTGILTPALWSILIISEHRHLPLFNTSQQIRSISGKYSLLITVCIISACILQFISTQYILFIIALCITIIVIAGTPKRWHYSVRYPFRFWFLFLFIAFFNLFFSYGTRIVSIPPVTREGLEETVRQSLRLWSWLELSLFLQRLHAHTFFFKLLKKLFPHRVNTLAAALIAFEFFPEVITFARSKQAREGINWRKLTSALQLYSNRIREFVVDDLSVQNGSTIQ